MRDLKRPVRGRRSVRALPDDFYEKIKPALHARIGREIRPAYRVLDLGCGGCDLVRYLRATYRQRVTGVDISASGFPDHHGGKVGRLRCIQGDAASLDFLRDGSMDAVVTMWALHEMADAAGVLREAHRVLRPGGKIVIVDFPRDSLAQKLWNENYYRPAEVERMLLSAGFGEVKVRLIHRGQVMLAGGFRAEAG